MFGLVLPLELQTFVMMMMSQVKGVRRRKEVLIDRREKIRRRSSVLIQMGAAFHFTAQGHQDTSTTAST